MATARQLAILDDVPVTAHPFCESPGRRPSQRTTVQELVYREPPVLDRVSKEDRHQRENRQGQAPRVAGAVTLALFWLVVLASVGFAIALSRVSARLSEDGLGFVALGVLGSGTCCRSSHFIEGAEAPQRAVPKIGAGDASSGVLAVTVLAAVVREHVARSLAPSAGEASPH